MRTQLGVCTRRALPDLDDVMPPDKQRRLAIDDPVAFEMCRLGAHEQLLAVDIHLRQLLRTERVFRGKLMKPKGFLEGRHLVARRSVQARSMQIHCH
ncbi:hypothetical protein D9M69_131820 [compost metagenome]